MISAIFTTCYGFFAGSVGFGAGFVGDAGGFAAGGFGFGLGAPVDGGVCGLGAPVGAPGAAGAALVNGFFWNSSSIFVITSSVISMASDLKMMLLFSPETSNTTA